jgi:endogenous inhibitor of DNA gyrase (YacG/DUF329 family)
MHPLTEPGDILQWDIYCPRCDWELTIQALVPFTLTAAGQQQSLDESTTTGINGFWEDYFCPTHFIHARRAVLVSSEIGLDRETAYFRYVSGRGQTTPVPACPTCHQQMVGGPALESLPFYLAPMIDLQEWRLHQVHALQRMVEAEKLAIKRGEQVPEEALQLLAGEVQSLNRFQLALCKQLHLERMARPLLDARPLDLDHWQVLLRFEAETIVTRLQQLHRRQAAETQKAPASCPNCGKRSLHLRLTYLV